MSMTSLQPSTAPAVIDRDPQLLPVELVESPRAVIAHLNSTHIVGAHPLHQLSEIPAGIRLRESLKAIEQSGYIPDVLVVTGLLAAFGEAEAYEELHQIVGAAAGAWGAKILWAPGDGDDLDCAADILGDGESLPAIVECRGLRLVRASGANVEDVLESVILTDEPSELGVILVLPESLRLDSMRSYIHMVSALTASSNVRAIIFGGGFNPTASQLGPIPMFSAGSTAFTFAGAAAVDSGQTFNFIVVDEFGVTAESLSSRFFAE